MPPVPAGPPSFHFRARLLDADGKPFGEREYMIVWGKERVMGWTTPDGDVDEQLQGNIEKGVLHLGEGSTPETFEAFISIPIVKVPEYPPPRRPLDLPEPAVRPPKERPQPPTGPEAENPNAIAEYNRKLRDWEDYEQQRQREEAERARKERELEKLEREEAAARTPPPELGPPAPTASRPARPAPPPPHPTNPIDWQKRVDALNQQRREDDALYRIQFELFWRLRNLGFVTVEFRGQQNFLMRGGDVSRLALEDACRRYAHKHQLAVPERADFYVRPLTDVLLDLYTHVRVTHEGFLGLQQAPSKAP